MNNAISLRASIAVVSFVLLSGLSYAFAPEANANGDPVFWFSVIPPILAVTLAFLTGRLIPSLAIAILIGVGLASQVKTGFTFGSEFLNLFRQIFLDKFSLQVLAFIILFLSTIGLLVVSGGLAGIVSLIAKYADSRRNTKLITVLLGFVVFIDDYANSMIVGGSMRTLCDKYRISREKLAFLVDATSAPISGLAFVSTWIGYEVGLFSDVSKSLGMGQSGYGIFLDAMGFRFYCILMIFFVLLNAFTEADFGPMAKAEKRAKESGNVHAHDAKPLSSGLLSKTDPDESVKVISAKTGLIPLALMFTVLMGGLWLDGGGGAVLSANPLSIFNPITWKDVMSASENNALVLAYSAVVGLLSAMISSNQIAKLSWTKIGATIAGGVRAAVLPAAILILAWTLKNVCTAVQTDQFLISVFSKLISPIWFAPFVFILAGVTAFATGTSWGTMAILIPTMAPIAFSFDGGTYGMITIITMGSILDGAIFGDHCSPISDTTVMSSISSGCDHIHHVQTQMPYALLVAAASLLFGYVPASFGISPLISYAVGAMLFAAIFFTIKKRSRVDGRSS